MTKAYFTTREIADSIGEQVGTVRSVAFRLFDRNEIEVKDNEFCFTVEQTEKIESVFKKENKGRENIIVGSASIAVKSASESTVSTKELAARLGTRPNVITENAKKCLPNKKIENGKATFWNEEEVTILLDFMKSNNNRTDLDLSNRLIGTSTDLTPALKIKKAMELMQEGYEEELSILRAKNAAQARLIEEQKPKAEYFDKVCDATNLTEIGTVGKALGIGAQKFFDMLRNDKVIKRKTDSEGISYYVAYYDYEKYFSTVQRPFEKSGKSLVRNKLMFNQKGVVWANRRYRMEHE